MKEWYEDVVEWRGKKERERERGKERGEGMERGGKLN